MWILARFVFHWKSLNYSCQKAPKGPHGLNGTSVKEMDRAVVIHLSHPSLNPPGGRIWKEIIVLLACMTKRCLPSARSIKPSGATELLILPTIGLRNTNEVFCSMLNEEQHYLLEKEQLYSGGSKGGRKGRAPPPLDQNFFIIMQFSEKIGQIIGWRPPL